MYLHSTCSRPVAEDIQQEILSGKCWEQHSDAERTEHDTDTELLSKAQAHRQTGARLASLLAGEILNHLSRSEADWALARLLGFWCGGDAERVLRIMRASGAVREKWLRRPQYLERTVTRAIASLTRFYTPPAHEADSGSRSLNQDAAKDENTAHKRSVDECSGAADRLLDAVEPPESAKSENGPGRGIVSPEGSNTAHRRSVDECVTSGDRLLDHIRGLRQRHGRPVGLSCRQAGELLGIPFKTAARRLKSLVESGCLIVTKEWPKRSRKSTEYDLPVASQPSPACKPREQATGGEKTKRCNGCQADKPTDAFHRNKANKRDGLCSRCKQCTAKARKRKPVRKHVGKPFKGPPHIARNGKMAVWWWSTAKGAWQHAADVDSQAAANREMANRPWKKWFSVGESCFFWPSKGGAPIIRPWNAAA